eukprot:9094545-Pyramimonas_sp.AAC.1
MMTGQVLRGIAYGPLPGHQQSVPRAELYAVTHEWAPVAHAPAQTELRCMASSMADHPRPRWFVLAVGDIICAFTPDQRRGHHGQEGQRLRGCSREEGAGHACDAVGSRPLTLEHAQHRETGCVLDRILNDTDREPGPTAAASKEASTTTPATPSIRTTASST